jgi:hypothetical protein
VSTTIERDVATNDNGVDDDGLVHTCRTFNTDPTHDCEIHHECCWSFCGIWLLEHEFLPDGKPRPGEQLCVVCEAMDR